MKAKYFHAGCAAASLWFRGKQSEPDLKRSALNLNLYHQVNSEIVCPSIHLPLLHPLTGWQRRREGGGWACPSILWAKGRGAPASSSHAGETIASNVNFKSPICLSPPNACLWTVAGSQSTQITPADAGESTQTQHREGKINKDFNRASSNLSSRNVGHSLLRCTAGA